MKVLLLLLLLSLLAAVSVPPCPATTIVQPPPATVTLGFAKTMKPWRLHLTRPYSKSINNMLYSLLTSTKAEYKSLKRYAGINGELVTMSINPTPSVIHDSFCKRFLPLQVPVIVFVTNTISEDRSAAQYFLQMTDYLQIPVIAWNADNTIYATRKQDSFQSLVLQMAPSIYHQAAAMLDILRKFNFHGVSVVTSDMAGHKQFVLAIRERIYDLKMESNYEFKTISSQTINASDPADVDREMAKLKATRTRIVLLHATRKEAELMFAGAKRHGLIGSEYLWLITQSTIEDMHERWMLEVFPVGAIGVYFDTSEEGVRKTLETAIKVFANGLALFHNDPRNANLTTVIKPKLSCDDEQSSSWHQGPELFKYLMDVSFTLEADQPDVPDIQMGFGKGGAVKHAMLEVINLRDMGDSSVGWQKVGTWVGGNLHINGIVWPGGGHRPPLGAPEKFHLKVSFLEEQPFLTYGSPDEATNSCHDKDVKCRVPALQDGYKDPTGVAQNVSMEKCCTGFTVDLLKMLARDLKFTFEMNRVADGLWGAKTNETWNGLIAELLDKTADMVVTSLKINKVRKEAIDFSVPFMDTGVSIVVHKQTGIISPQAILEPFDTVSWLLILVVSVQAAAVAIFLFEYLTPVRRGEADGSTEAREFTLFRTFWMVWAMLLGAAVEVICPRGTTAKFVANIWATFALIFNAIYTANLAAFMITRERYHNLEGVNDPKLISENLRFGTVPFGNTETILQIPMFDELSRRMKNFSRPTVGAGVKAVKNDELDAFIYDAAVLDYLAGQDDSCGILTVGKWFAKTGYGIGFPKSSQYLADFNDRLLYYRSQGELERLEEFWFSGACSSQKGGDQKASSHPSLAVNQFISPFLLLAVGILLAAILVAAEICYDAHLRKRLVKGGIGRKRSVIALLSQNLARSLTFEEAVSQVQERTRVDKNKCTNPQCDMARRKVDLYKVKVMKLEAELKSRPAIQLEDLQGPYRTTLEPEGAHRPGTSGEDQDVELVSITTDEHIKLLAPAPNAESRPNKLGGFLQPGSKDTFYIHQWHV